MIRFSCPSCEAVLEAPESKGGGIMCCPECDQKMQVPEAPEKPSRSGRDDDDAEEADDVVEDLEEVDEGDERSNGKGKSTAITSAPSKKKSAGARATDDNEDDDSDEDAEEEVRPKKKKRKAEEGSSSVLVVLLIVLGVVALAGAGVGVYMLTSKDDGKVAKHSSSSTVTPPPPASSAVSSSVDSGSSSPPSSSVPDASSSAGSGKEPDPLHPVVDTGNRGPMVYERLKKSTTLIYVWTQTSGNFPGQSGSGFVIDRKNRLVLTNYHVIEGGTKVVVLFPELDKGQMISEKKYYQTKAISGTIPASTVVVKDERRDLALVQLPQPPPQGTLGLRPAEKEPASGAKVYSVGSPGASGGAFVYTGGDVKSVYQKKWKVSLGGKILPLEARVVETTSPTNPGDSGGPLANDDGEFVGVTEGGSVEANSVSFFIATSEVKSFLSENLPKLNPPVTWEVEKEGALEPVGTGAFTAASLEGLKKVLKEPDARRRADAARAIGTIPANDARSAIPDLLDAVKDEDDNVSRRAQESLTKIGGASKFEVGVLVKKYLTDSDARVKFYAIQAVAPTGADGASACDVLIELTKDSSPEIRREALFALGKVGIGDREKVFPVLFGQLKESKDAQTRSMLGQALASLGPLTASEVNILKDNLAHPVSEVRVYCAKSLGQLGPAAKVAVPALKDDLKSNDLVTAIAAAEALGKIGPEAKEAKPALLEAFQSKEPALSKAAAEALVEIKDFNKGDVAALTTALKSGSTHVKIASLVILGSSGLDAKDVLGPINDALALKDQDKAVRVQAMKSLASFASGSPDAVAKLIQAAKDQDNEIRVAAVRALVKVGSAAGKDAVRALDHMLSEDAQKDKNFDVEFAKEIVVALGEMKLEGKKDEYQEIYKLEARVCTHLVDLLEKDRYAPLAEAIGTSLGKIGTAALVPSPPHASPIERMLASPIPVRRYYGAFALNEVAPELKKADPKMRLGLVKFLDDLIMKEGQKPDADPRTKPMLEQARDKIKTDV